MASLRELSWVPLATVVLFLGSGVLTVRADAMVTGSVFCDVCKDGERSLFDYPLFGAKVAVACGWTEGAASLYKEESTNWFGGYAMRFEGSPELSACSVRVVGGPEACGAAAGPAQGLRLMFRIFGMAMYIVDPLLAQPPRPMSFCPTNHDNPPAITPPPSPLAPVVEPPPMLPPLLPPPVPVSRPRLPPFMQASACAYEYSLFLCVCVCARA